MRCHTVRRCVAHKDGVTVGLRLRDKRRTNGAASAAAIVHHHGLTEEFGNLGCDLSGSAVDVGTRCKRNYHAHGPVRIVGGDRLHPASRENTHAAMLLGKRALKIMVAPR